MPEYTVRDPETGRTLVLKGDSPPTEEELEQIFKQVAPPEAGPIARYGAGLWKAANPVAAVAGLYEAVKSPEAVSHTLEGIYDAAIAQFGKAKEAYRQGDLEQAAAYTTAGLLPILGPAATGLGERIRKGEDVAGALGETTGMVGSMLLPGAVAKVLPAGGKIPIVPKLARAAVDPVGEAVAWGLRRKLPVDPATATGSKYIRGLQGISERTIGGTFIGQRARAGQEAALAAQAAELAERAAPGVPSTPETAGLNVRGEVVQTGRARAGEARKEYGTLRQAEENLINADYVPEDLPAAVKARMAEELGDVPTPAEIQELRRIREELDAVPFQPGKLIVEDLQHGETTYSHRAPGAPVFHEILQEAPGTSSMTRAEVQKSIELALRTGRMTNAARGALAVAKKRLSEGGWRYAGLDSPVLPPEAGQVLVGMKLPVDLRPVKAALQPLYDQLRRQKELTGLLLGPKARVLTALDTLMTAGDHAPLSQVDAALSDLKGVARSGDVPELRTAGEGMAGRAVEALDAQVRAAAEKAGPDVLGALERGRAATRAKYVARELLQSLGKKGEGVGVYRKAIAANDANAGLLRDLAKHAPETLPQIGRAFLEELLHKATAEGGFNRAQGLLADWQRLGPQTKALLFKDAAHVKDLDNFFLLAKKMAENANPSGSGFTAIQGGELFYLYNNPASGATVTLGGAALAGLLHSPRVTRLLLQGFKIPVSAKVARAAWAGQLQKAIAATEGAPGLVPAAAEGDEAAFQQWYTDRAQKLGLNPDPDDAQQVYDYRAAFQAGAEPDASGHWPSQFKREGHPNEVVGGFNTRTGERVPGTRQASEAELIELGWDPATAKRLSAR